MRDRDTIKDGHNTLDGRRFWCSYLELEEYHAGMWHKVSGVRAQTDLMARAVALLRSPERFTVATSKVIDEWPVSCRAEFTGPGNHVAWMGQAACCLVDGVPEELTRRGWWKLSDREMLDANAIARSAITDWMVSHEQSFSGAQIRLFEGRAYA